jgi:hypothetical protein
MSNFDLKKYLENNVLYEEVSSEEEEQQEEDLTLSAIDYLESALTNLNEKLEGIDKEEERMLRLFRRFKKEGKTDELYAMAFTLRTKGVEALLQKKFIDYAYNDPEGLAKFGGEMLKRDIKAGVTIDSFEDSRVRFSGKADNPLNTPKGSFVKSVFDFILGSNVDESSKFALIDLISDPRNLIPGSAFEGDVVRGNLLDLVSPKIKKNKAFKEVANNILRFKQGRAVGAGEGFLTVFGRNSQKSQGKNDINIDGVDIEVKASPNGGWFTIDDGGGDKGKGVDQMNKRYFPYLKTGSALSLEDPRFVEYITEKGKPHLNQYFTELYPVLSDSDISQMTNITWDNLGKSRKEISNLVKDLIFKSYKNLHNMDSFVVIDTITGDFTATSSDKLPSDLVGKDWALTKGTDTQATPAGFIRLSREA